jgi:hypothetical protein
VFIRDHRLKQGALPSEGILERGQSAPDHPSQDQSPSTSGGCTK